MGTPPLPTTVGRTAERRFLLEGNVSMASTDVSTHTHSLLGVCGGGEGAVLHCVYMCKVFVQWNRLRQPLVVQF